MKRLLALSVAALLLVVVVAGWFLVTRGYTVRLTQSDLQTQFDQVFPIEEKYQILTLGFSDPQVVLEEGSDRIRLALTATATVPALVRESGSAAVSGQVHYDRDTGALYLRNSRVEEISLPKLPEQYLPHVREFSSLALAQVLERVPFHRIPEDQKIARLALRSVRVAEGRLNIELGLRP